MNEMAFFVGSCEYNVTKINLGFNICKVKGISTLQNNNALESFFLKCWITLSHTHIHAKQMGPFLAQLS